MTLANGGYYGFFPAGGSHSSPQPRPYLHSASDAAAIAAGDFVIKSSGYPGYVGIATAASDTSLLGVAANSCAASTAGTVFVYDDPECIFRGCVSGTMAQIYVDVPCDFEGTTGAMLLNEDAVDQDLCQIISAPYKIENGEVLFKILKHQNAPN